MSKLLEEAIAQVRELPEAAQETVAVEMMRYAATASEPHLSEEQVAEVRRRRAERNPATLTLEELDERLRRLGV
jgi:hypothetical protein